MAISLIGQYPTKVGAADANYPYGNARNITVPSDGTGTPWEEAWIKDKEGFFQGLLTRATPPIVPSGAADTVLVSDYHDALDSIYLKALGTLRANATVPLPGEGDRYPRGHMDGCLHTWVSGVSLRTEIGSRRNQANTHDMDLDAPIAKTINATWTVGDGGGGLPDGLAIAAGPYRRFLVMKPDGTTDVCWDTSDTAANFFLDANAIAAGYSDASLYKRLRWDIWTGAAVDQVFNEAADPTYNYFLTVQSQFAAGNVNTSPRQAFTCSDIPPDCYAEMNWYVNADDSIQILVTQLEGSDQSASATRYTFRNANNADSGGVISRHKVDLLQRIYARKTLSSGNVNVFNMTTPGWYDPGVLP